VSNFVYGLGTIECNAENHSPIAARQPTDSKTVADEAGKRSRHNSSWSGARSARIHIGSGLKYHFYAFPTLCIYTEFGERAFSLVALAAWNCLARDVRDAPSLEIFKLNQKTDPGF